MRCVIRLHGELAERSATLCSVWEAEHLKVYSTRRGAPEVALPFDLTLLEGRPRGRLGYATIPRDRQRLRRWLRSSGNWSAILIRPGEIALIVSERRRGVSPSVAALFEGAAWDQSRRLWLKDDLVAARVITLESRNPDANPLLPDEREGTESTVPS